MHGISSKKLQSFFIYIYTHTMYMNECIFLIRLSEGDSNACLATVFKRTKIPASMTTEEVERKVLKQL